MKNERKEYLSALLPMLPLTLAHTLLSMEAFPSLGGRWFIVWPILYALSALLYLLQHTRVRRFVLPVVIAAAVAAAAFSVKGFSYLVHDFFTAMQRASGHIYLPPETAGRRWTLRAAFLLAGAVIQSLAAKSGSPVWLVPMLLPILEGSVAGILPVSFATAILVVGLLLQSGLRGADVRTAMQRAAAIVLCAALTAGSAFLLQRAPQEKAVQQIRRAAHAVVYDRRTNSMPEGRLSRLGPWEKSDAPALAVTMESPQRMYLRGAIFETYTGKEWLPLSAAARDEYGELFSWLHANGYYGQSAVYTNLAALTDAKPQKMRIENRSACRAHGYLPYGAGGQLPFDETLIGDAAIPAKARECLCIATDTQTLYAASEKAADAPDSARARMEASLAAYAQNVDRTIPPETQQVIAELYGAPKRQSTADTLRDVRRFLQKQIAYSETVETRVQTDFLETLFQQKSGYSVHYATAAVLLLRYCGIPARYAEGYYLPEQDAKHAASDAPLVLTEENAHAWAEVYLDGIGFVPFEVTPGYADADEQDGESPGKSDAMQRPHTPIGAPTVIPEPTPTAPLAPQEKTPSLWMLLLPGLLIVAVVLWLLFRRRRFEKRLLAMQALPCRERVLAEYAYAAALEKRFGFTLPDQDRARALFLEARFSDHEITEEMCAQMHAFLGEAFESCLANRNPIRRFWYRFLHPIVP